MDESNESHSHPSTEELSAYVDGALGAEARARVESHLADCDACRAEVVEVRALLRGAPPGGRRRGWRRPVALAGLAAAAAALFVMLPRQGGDREGAHVPPRMGAGAQRERSLPEARAITTVSPARDEQVPAGAVRLLWHAVDRDATYRVYVVDPDGTERWSGTTTDTSIAVPDARLARGSNYRWYVEALHANGATSRSASEPFSVRP